MKQSITISKFTLFAFIALFSFYSCNTDEDPIEVVEGTKGPYENGIFITNEGSFGSNNGSISYYQYEDDTTYNMTADQVYNNVFNTVNDSKLGDVVQSMNTQHDSLGLILVNASNKVEIVNKYTMESIEKIDEEISGPRYASVIGDIAYVSCWGDNSVKVIDLGTYTITNSISVGAGPEKMAIVNEQVYVANAGGWGTDSVVSVIDMATEEVTASIDVKYSPRDIEVDKDGNVWVLCYGKVVYQTESPWGVIEETPSMLYKIDPNTNTVSKSFELFDTQHPTSLAIDNDGETMYIGGGYGFGGIYSFTETSSTATKIIDDYAYGFGYDTDSEILFVTVAPDFTGAGQLIRYATDGTKLGEYAVGIGPNGTSFKNARQ